MAVQVSTRLSARSYSSGCWTVIPMPSRTAWARGVGQESVLDDERSRR